MRAGGKCTHQGGAPLGQRMESNTFGSLIRKDRVSWKVKIDPTERQAPRAPAVSLPPCSLPHCLRLLPHSHNFYLASPKHICDSTAAQIGCGNDILLATRVARGNSLGCCHGDTLGHSDEIFWGGGLGRWLWGTEDLLGQNKKKNFTVNETVRQHNTRVIWFIHPCVHSTSIP